MHAELSVALNFFLSFLYNKLPRRRVNLLGEEISKILRRRFEGHWYPDQPYKGSAYRCWRVGQQRCDQVLGEAAVLVGIEMPEIFENLPEDLTLWIDPGEVSYRIGERGTVKILYQNGSRITDGTNSEAMEREPMPAPPGFNPNAQVFQPIESSLSLSSSFSSLSLSPTSPESTPWSMPSPIECSSPMTAFIPGTAESTTYFTTAAFAQTKFGSTKSKNASRRSPRMLPTEFSAYIKQKTHVPHNLHPMDARSRSVSPDVPTQAAPATAVAAAADTTFLQRPNFLPLNPTGFGVRGVNGVSGMHLPMPTQMSPSPSPSGGQSPDSEYRQMFQRRFSAQSQQQHRLLLAN